MELTMYARHVSRWQNCDRCHLHEGRRQVVFGRGTVPCDVLFVGEAPGDSENAIGQPFIGPAGHEMDRWISAATSVLEEPLRLCWYNLIGCIPRDKGGHKAHEPEDECIEACKPRLEEFVRTVAQPRLIVCVGRLAYGWLDPGYRHSVKVNKAIKQVEVIHPAAVLRAPTAQKGLMVQRAVINLRNAFQSLSETGCSGK